MKKIVKPFFKQNEFTQVSNVIFDILLPRISANEFKVLAIIIRKTTGWHKEFDELSLSQIKTLTGIKTNATVAAAIRGLEKARVILVDRPDISDPARCRGSNIYSLNLDLKLEIEVEENYLGLSTENEPEGGCSKIEQGVVQKLNTPSSKIEQGVVQKLNTQNKESLNKESKEKGESATPKKAISKKQPQLSPSIPESVKVYQEAVHRFPPKALWPKITGTVTADPAGLERWRAVILAWLGCGWNPLNVAGMLEFFERNETPSTRNPTHAKNQPSSGKTIPTGIGGLQERGTDNPIKKRCNIYTGETYYVDARSGERVDDVVS